MCHPEYTELCCLKSRYKMTGGGSWQVLELAHEAEVKARIMDDGKALAQAREYASPRGRLQHHLFMHHAS